MKIPKKHKSGLNRRNKLIADQINILHALETERSFWLTTILREMGLDIEKTRYNVEPDGKITIKENGDTKAKKSYKNS